MDTRNLADLYALPALDRAQVIDRLDAGCDQAPGAGEVDGSRTALTAPFSAPSAGAPPWSAYRVIARSASPVATVEPGGATRWTF